MMRRCEVGRRGAGSAGRRASCADIAGVVGAGRVYARRWRRVSVERARVRAVVGVRVRRHRMT